MEEQDLSSNSLEKFLKEKGPIWAVLLTVAFNIIVLLSELFGEASDPVTWKTYAGTAGVGTLVFLIFTLIIYRQENSVGKAFLFRILREENHYDIERVTDRTVRIICKQKLVVRALHNNESKFRLFNPLAKYTPSRFEFLNGMPRKLEQQEFKMNIDGIGIYFPNREFSKGVSEEITAIWTYEDVPLEAGIMAATIRRPTSSLKISVCLPAESKVPQKTGWQMHNLEKYVVKTGNIKCTNYGNQYFITKYFWKTKEGFSYTLWWDF